MLLAQLEMQWLLLQKLMRKQVLSRLLLYSLAVKSSTDQVSSDA